MYTIGRLAKLTGCTIATIHFYGRQGLLASDTRTSTGYKLYSEDARSRLELIAQARACGLSLADIADVVRALEREPGAGRRAAEILVARGAELERAEAALASLARLVNGREMSAPGRCAPPADTARDSGRAGPRRPSATSSPCALPAAAESSPAEYRAAPCARP